MNIFGWDISRKTASTISLDQLVRRLEAIYGTTSGTNITPENCMESPTVHAIVTGISRGISSCPVHVYQKGTKNGLDTKEVVPNHPIERLLKQPNQWQSPVEYWQDATSSLMRYGYYVAYKAQGNTGPIRRLIPLKAASVELKQADDYSINATIAQANGQQKEVPYDELHYARGPARDFLRGNSPIVDCREAIGLEIAAEKFGASFFGGGAMPGIVFKFQEGFQAFKTDEEKKKFIEDFQAAHSNRGRFRSMLLPKGIDMSDKLIGFENDKAQFLETRKYQRTVIAGAFGVPPYLVGDLERQTFNNAEQQNINKISEVLLPIARIFESAMERDLLTKDDRNGGIIIRFNLDGLLRGDFKTRQEGLKIQRESGVINPDEWREVEGMNPRTDGNGGIYWDTGPSGQGAPQFPGEPGAPAIPPPGTPKPPQNANT